MAYRTGKTLTLAGNVAHDVCVTKAGRNSYRVQIAQWVAGHAAELIDAAIVNDCDSELLVDFEKGSEDEAIALEILASAGISSVADAILVGRSSLGTSIYIDASGSDVFC